jgi:acyl-homoserine lactone acylase PvdQ
MKKLVLVAAIAVAAHASGQAPGNDAARWEQQALNVTIIRDDWGIAHVYGKTDADAVFGMIYAQAEDDFNRVEANYLTSLGRTAEAEGESKIWQDLRMRLIIDPDTLKAEYASSPVWLKSLMNAWADGLNFYLAKHPQVKPRVITRWEPWMALSFTEGSIGGDIEKVNLNRLQAFYGGEPPMPAASGEEEDESLKEPSGSNGIVVSPANTTVHHSLLLINPHTSFFFRSELQMASDEGLNAYGAVTWGQFFVYQGFNDHAGWMHTSSGVDATDEFLETVSSKPGGHYYKVGSEERPMHSWPVIIRYKTGNGMAERKFTLYRTEHGPIVREENGKWVSFALMQSSVKALTQSYTRTKATDYKSFLATMQLHTNSSNNTLFADQDGDIAYFHGNYIPRRDTSFDWTKPVDGSNPATAYHGLLSVDETPHLLNPASGWIYNSNDAPWQASGPNSPKPADFPRYVETGGESARGHHAVRVLQDRKDFTLDGLRNAAFDSYQTWFEKPIPALIRAWDSAPASDTIKAKVAEQIAMLRTWDLRWSATSVPTSLAIYWAQALQRAGGRGRGNAAENAARDQMLQALAAASDRLAADFGSWKTPWGEINRFQRSNDDIVATFTDARPSIPVMFSSANWGSLASFGARQYPGTKRIYGTSGNSFVAVVEFGDSVRAKAVTAGGESGDPASRHFNDQATRYATGELRPVYYYRSQLTGHTEREYHPGT